MIVYNDSEKEIVKETDKILGNKKKFKRAMLILIPVLILFAYGFYTHEISRIIMAILGK